MFEQIKSAVEFATHLPRYREIVGVLLRYGFADALRLVALQRFLGVEDAVAAQHESGMLAKPLPERLRLALEELGPTFVKFGQIVSSRRDLVTDEYYTELCKLQSSVPPFAARDARRILSDELGQPADRLFAEFDDVPAGSASIAQVHRAVLRDGTVVAVKIQRPGILKTIELDLAILLDLARFVDRHVPDLAALNPAGVVNEFSATLLKELDFSNEAANLDRFAKQFAGREEIKVPAVFHGLSTARVLCMEFITGFGVEDPSALREAGIDPEALAARSAGLIYEQIFDFGFFHADPHPGNFLVLPGGVAALLDYGMMGSFSPGFRSSIAHLVAGLAEKNHQQVMQSILAMSEEGFTAEPARMLADIESFSEAHLNRPLRDINLGLVLNRLLDLLRTNRLRMKSNFYLGVKALTQVEAIGRILAPDIDFIALGEPCAAKLIRGRFGPGRITGVLRSLAGGGLDFLEDFPHDFRNLYQRFKHGKVNIPLEHKIDPLGFEPLRKTLDSIANRLSNAILAASVLICSAILTLAQVPPELGGTSVPGVLGLGLGFFMCLRLAISIWKHGGL